MENKNVGLAFTLVFAIYLAYIMLFSSGPPKTVPQEPVPAVQEQAPAEEREPPAQSDSKMVEIPVAQKIVPSEFQNLAKREVIVENDLFKAVLSNQGAKINQFELKQFRSTQAPDSPNIFLIDSQAEKMATLGVSGSDGLLLSSDALYKISASEKQIKITSGQSRQVVFSTIQGNLLVEKIFTFYGDSYKFDLDLRLKNLGDTPLNGGVQVSLLEPWQDTGKEGGGFLSGGSFSFVGTATLVGGDLKTDSVKDLGEKSASYSDQVQWTSFEDKYFIKALVPVSDFKDKKVYLEKGENYVQNRLEIRGQELTPGKGIEMRFLGYFGPRDTEILKAVGHNLDEAVDFGYFHIIAKPLLEVLKFFNSFVGNYGVAIIILTVLIKLIFWPLTQKSYTSMKAMQKIQPEMAKIRVKFKNDKARLNKEVMDLYRKHKVNPLGGCLPMLIQIPVFFALYKVLLEDIGLRHAPFMFWIQDLSAKDPYYITPVVMGITMFVQQKLTPTTMDSTQAKLLNYMPLIFTFMFLNFPSGLVIYWLVNNLLTILQQYLIHRKPTATVEA